MDVPTKQHLPKPGESFADLYPEMAKQFSTKNLPLTASMLKPKSAKTVAWECQDCGFEWEVSVKSRTIQGTGCSACSGQTIVPGRNTFAAKYPEYVDELVSPDINLDAVSVNNSTQCIWKCKQCHNTWKLSVFSRGVTKKGCPYCASFATTNPTMWSEIHPEGNEHLDLSRLTENSNEKIRWQCQNNPKHSWIVSPNQRTFYKTGCPQCTHIVSGAEDDLSEFFDECGLSFLRNDRIQIKPLELDFYFPEQKIGVEYNGLVWHSEKYTENDYHQRKLQRCLDSGIKLIMIWEDEWLEKPDIVKRMLKSKLGISDESSIFARQTTVDSHLDVEEANSFLQKYHIQGKGAGSVHIGLRDATGDLCAVCIFKRHDRDLELVRYATSCTVPGGQSKILSWVDKNVDYNTMYTFADLSKSTGELYQKTGWTLENVLAPDYMYVVQQRRVHKFNFRKSSFKSKPGLKYEEGMTERELAKLNKLHRIYDCGKLKYSRKRQN